MKIIKSDKQNLEKKTIGGDFAHRDITPEPLQVSIQKVMFMSVATVFMEVLKTEVGFALHYG